VEFRVNARVGALLPLFGFGIRDMGFSVHGIGFGVWGLG
jgi:hypothetical protein